MTSDVEGWVAALDRIRALDVEHVIPGHGPVQGKAYLATQRAFLLEWKTAVAVIVGQFLIAVYGGYFGAGIGILMLAVLPFMGTKSIHETNAAKTILAGCINAVTVVIFAVKGVVQWEYALPMAAAAILGGYTGGHFARRLPAIYVRAIVIVIGFGLGGYYLWKQFGGD